LPTVKLSQGSKQPVKPDVQVSGLVGTQNLPGGTQVQDPEQKYPGGHPFGKAKGSHASGGVTVPSPHRGGAHSAQSKLQMRPASHRVGSAVGSHTSPKPSSPSPHTASKHMRGLAEKPSCDSMSDRLSPHVNGKQSGGSAHLDVQR